jgi:hypothetical protein
MASLGQPALLFLGDGKRRHDRRLLLVGRVLGNFAINSRKGF